MTNEDRLTPEEEAEEAENNRWFFANCVQPMQRLAVHSLLAGNDTCCFTTQQFLDAYAKVLREKLHIEDTGYPYRTELVKEHLRALGLTEVQPDVWMPEVTV